MVAAVPMINDMIIYDHPASNNFIADDELLPFVMFVMVTGNLNQFPDPRTVILVFYPQTIVLVITDPSPLSVKLLLSRMNRRGFLAERK